MRWTDVRLDMALLYVAPDTKTGRREVPLRQEALDRLKAVRTRRDAYCRERGIEFDESAPVFVLPNGEPCRDLHKLFNKVVRRCKFARRAGEMPYSPYSLRHTFATFSLAEGRSYEWLEQVMGSTMVRRQYVHSTIEQAQRYLRQKQLLQNASEPAAPAPQPPIYRELDLIDEADLPPGDWRHGRVGVVR